MGRTSDAKERLMDAALDLIWEESYGAVTIDDICKRAEVKKGSFYYFFESKEALATAALERMWAEDWKPHLDNVFSPSLDPLTRLTNYFEGIYPRTVELKAKHGKVLGCPVCSVGAEVGPQECAIGTKIREIMSRKRRYYESAIRDAIAEGQIEPCDPAIKTIAIAGLIEGLVVQSRIMNEPEVTRELTAAALGLLRVKSPASAAVSAK